MKPLVWILLGVLVCVIGILIYIVVQLGRVLAKAYDKQKDISDECGE